MQELPQDIRATLLKTAKSWLLGNYVGGKKRLSAWSDHYAHLTSIRSCELPGPVSANLRRLAKLAEAGVLTERARYRDKVGTRSFYPRREDADAIGAEAVAYWQSLGYVVDQLMSVTEAHQQAQRAQAQKGL